jgi:hypothetical protein
VKTTVSVNVLDCRVQFTIVSVHVIKANGEGEVQPHSYEAPALYGVGQLNVAAAFILGRVNLLPIE